MNATLQIFYASFKDQNAATVHSNPISFSSIGTYTVRLNRVLDTNFIAEGASSEARLNGKQSFRIPTLRPENLADVSIECFSLSS